MLRDGGGFVPKADTVIEAGDEVLLVLDPGLEDDITAQFPPQRAGAMAMPDVDVLLIGGGLAAGQLRALAARGGLRRVDACSCGRELDPPYNRPPCSKGYLQGKEPREEVLFRPDEWWTEQNIDLRTRTSVTKLDPAAKVATLSTREEVSFDKALARHRRQRAPAARRGRRPSTASTTCARCGNSDAIRADVEDAERVVVVGGSYIGTEVAASLTAAGQAGARW